MKFLKKQLYYMICHHRTALRFGVGIQVFFLELPSS